mgnify:CR=1 FL=1
MAYATAYQVLLVPLIVSEAIAYAPLPFVHGDTLLSTTSLAYVPSGFQTVAPPLITVLPSGHGALALRNDDESTEETLST